MKKEEILAKSRKENIIQDEREKIINDKAKAVGKIGMIIVLIIICITRMIFGKTDISDLCALGFGYLSAESIYKYILLRRKRDIPEIVFNTAFAIFWLVMYILSV